MANERVHPNTMRPIPSSDHHDIGGRVGHLHSLPKPEGPRMAAELERTHGHIRGPLAEKMHRLLQPYLAKRARSVSTFDEGVRDTSGGNLEDVRDSTVVSGWIAETPSSVVSGESRSHRGGRI